MTVWQQFIFQPVGGFVIVLLGTMFLFAEVLVKGRFLLGVLGLAAIGLYFTVHVQEGQLIWMALLYVIGIVLVMIDGKLIGDGTLALIGVLMMLVSLAWPSPSILYGVGVAVAFIVGGCCAFIFPRFLPRRDLWSKLALKDALTSEKGYNVLNETYRTLPGKVGIAQTDFRPTGTIEIEGRLYSASTEGRWVGKGTRLKVSKVTGTHILVVPADQEDQD